MFSFKQFSIRQDRTAMKVGTDGVLLGAWVNLNGAESEILDIGTGTSLIALMMAQRCEANVDAVEIDESSASQAVENIAASPWSDRVEVYCTAIQEFRPTKKYDLIVSNPPYFCNSLLSPNAERNNARHTTSLSFNDLIESVMRLLTQEGRFALILPINEFQLFEKEVNNRLFLNRICNAKGFDDGETIRVMSEWSLSSSASKDTEAVVIRDRSTGDFNAGYKSLTADFYLKF